MSFYVYVFLLFMIYSFFGYVVEMIAVALEKKKFVNRGFLCGPVIPIYGIGSLLMLITLLRYKSDPVVVFVFGMIICSALEYFTSFLLEKIFHNIWWDYFDYKYNINGRICLENSVLFGLGGIAIIYCVQPIVDTSLQYYNAHILNMVALISFIILLIDVIYSVIVAFNLRNRLIIVEELKNEKLAKIPAMFEKLLVDRVSKFKLYPTRLLKAFPRIKMDNYKAFKIMKKISIDKISSVKNGLKSKK